MIPVKHAGFKYIDRGYKDTLVLIPGWATDYRIFESLDLRYNYLFASGADPFCLKEELQDYLRANNIYSAAVLGYSLGGFVAAEFASEHADVIKRLILISIRRGYDKTGLERIKVLIKKNPRAYLHNFYMRCLSNKHETAWFREGFLDAYCEGFEPKALFRGLDYLETARITPGLLRGIGDIKIVHGSLDKIAPPEEAADISNRLKQAELILIKGAGHIPFICPELRDRI